MRSAYCTLFAMVIIAGHMEGCFRETGFCESSADCSSGLPMCDAGSHRCMLHMVPMASIPAGMVLTMGWTMQAFELDRTEVTVAEYRACVLSEGCKEEPGTGSPCNWPAMEKDDHPINCVDWNQANDFCQWANKRLPTDREWQYAAGGPMLHNDEYPWGDSPGPMDEMGCWIHKSSDMPDGTCPVGSFQDLKLGQPAPYMEGLVDMAGNVYEWVDTAGNGGDQSCQQTPTTYLVHGGSWLSPSYKHPEFLSVTDSGSDYDTCRTARIGFRCAKSVD